MKLTEQQVTRLYKFTREHFVYHYDLQTELVDHLAHGIQAHWELQPNVSFEDALHKEFKKFGVFGFQDVIAERQKALHKKYTGFIWEEWKLFFSWPKIVGVVLSTVLVYFLLSTLLIEYQKITLIVSFLTMALILMFKGFDNKRSQKKKERLWYLEELLFQQGAYANFLLLPVHGINMASNIQMSIENTYVLLALSFLLVAYGLFLYVALLVLPEKSRELLLKTYPEYEMVEGVAIKV